MKSKVDEKVLNNFSMHNLGIKDVENVDFVIGNRIKFFRKNKGLSQKNVAEMLGISYQQFQKYENAQNRLSVSRLLKIAKILEVSAAKLLEFNDCNSVYNKVDLDKVEILKVIELYSKLSVSSRSKLLEFINILDK